MFPVQLQTVCETARLFSLQTERRRLAQTTTGAAWRTKTQAMLKRFGFTKLGSGAGGVAYGHPTYPYIIKAYRNDRAFRLWMDFVRKHQSNPWVPRLRGKNIRIGETEFVRIERLQPLRMSGWEWNTAVQLGYAFEMMVAHPDTYTRRLNTIAGPRRALIGERISEIESDPDLYDILAFFYQHPAAWIDLHMGNWMHRDGQLVIIDPLFARKPLRSLGQS